MSAASPKTFQRPMGDAREIPERGGADRPAQRSRKLGPHLKAYVAVNAFLVGWWAATGAGYFWPGWLMAGWGVLLLAAFVGATIRRISVHQLPHQDS
jgi:2TM domain